MLLNYQINVGNQSNISHNNTIYTIYTFLSKKKYLSYQKNTIYTLEESCGYHSKTNLFLCPYQMDVFYLSNGSSIMAEIHFLFLDLVF